MSTSLEIDGSITRAHLALADLAIHSVANGYVFLRDLNGPSAISWRKNTTTSPFVHGRYVVSAVKDVSTVAIGIRVYGVDHPQLDIRLAALIDAFEQPSYTLTLGVDGISRSYLCEAADWTIASGGYNSLELYSHTQEIHFSVPRYPIPISGQY